jgi:hypothetical protein
MDDRENTRSSNLNCRFLFLAWALFEVRNSLKPCTSAARQRLKEKHGGHNWQQRRHSGQPQRPLNSPSQHCRSWCSRL